MLHEITNYWVILGENLWGRVKLLNMNAAKLMSNMYLSYHNTNLHVACQLALAFQNKQKALWFDRFCIPPNDNWSQGILEAQAQADSALIILSKDYFTTNYCIEELASFRERNIPLVGILTEDIPLSLMDGTTGFVDIVDLHDSQDSDAMKLAVSSICEAINLETNSKTTSERNAYVYQLIAELEEKLQPTAIGRMAQNMAGFKLQDKHIRPRGYFPDLLLNGSYTLAVDGDTIPLENLISLLEIEPNLALTGDSGAGKSTFACIIGLLKAHQYLANEQAQLPVYLDLAQWGKFDSFEEFLTSEWQLAYHWQEWMKDNSVFFIIDNIEIGEEYHPTYLAKIDDYCILPEYHGCMIVVSEVNDHINNHLSAVVNLELLKQIHIDKLGRSILNDYQVDQLEALYQDVNPSSHMWRLDYACFSIEAILADYEIDEMPHHFAAKIVYDRWKRFTQDIELPIAFDEFLEMLKYLAWYMLLSDTPKTIVREDALEQLGDSAFIDLALDMNLLVYAGQFLRFESHFVQTELASYILLIDGAYKHLKNPRFGEHGQRIPTKWDEVVVSLYSVIEEEQYQDIVEQVDDIDPFLAVKFARQNYSLFYRNHYQLIEKLLDIRQKYPEAHYAVEDTICDFPFIDDTALSLVRLMRDYQWNMKTITYALLLRLPVLVPEDVLQAVRELDRDFYDARRNLLSLQSSNQWIVYLSYLIHNSDPTVRRNAIHLLGDVGDIVALPALLSLIQSDSQTIRQDTLSAISRIMDEEHLQILFEWLPENFADYTSLADVFFHLDRDISGYIVRALDNSETEFNRQIILVLIRLPETDVKKVMAQSIKNQSNLAEAMSIEPVEGEQSMKLHELLQRRLNKMKDTATFNRLVDDSSAILTRNSTRPQDDIRDEDSDEQGAQVLKRRRARPKMTKAEGTAVPESLHDALDHDEWLIRYKALQELASYPAKAIKPLLVKASQDEDVQVRVAALDILANFSKSADIRKVFVDALKDDDHLVIDTSTDHIKDFDTLETELLLPLLKHENVQTVAAVIEILTDKQDAKAVPALISLLDDTRTPWLSEKTLGHYAAKALIMIGTPTALSAIKEFGFVDAPDLSTVIPPAIEHQDVIAHNPTKASANGKKKSGKTYTPEEKIRLTLIALRGDRWELSQKAARYMRDLAKSLQGTSDPKIIKPLEDALSDEVWTVRWVVVEALAWIKSTESIPKMLPLLGDSNWMIQVATIRALAELKAVETAPKIAILLQSANSGVSEAAAEALGILKNSESLTALRTALKSKDEFVRLSALKSIFAIQGKHSVPYLISALNDSYNHVRWFAIKNLSQFATQKELPAIITLLPDKSGPIWEKKNISDYAQEALENINTRESLSILKEWAEQNDLSGENHEDIY